MSEGKWALRFGAAVQPDGVMFRVWAPRLDDLQVVIRSDPPMVLAMQQEEEEGEFAVFAEGLGAGCDYMLRTGAGRQLPDPVSRWLPHGVHGPTRVLDSAAFSWSDQNWRGIPLRDYLIYELHTGTFSPEGTFAGIVPRLSYLRELGVTAVEIMPVAEFPGRRNWGYDGVGMYAPQSSYGGPAAFKSLVDACHQQGLAVVLDVVYNHLGPEGNYLSEFGPFFTSCYRTPWGDAINYGGAGSDGVRRFFVDNALYWLNEYHVDALRLDAIHGIFDPSARHFLREMADEFHAEAARLGRAAFLIAESDLNDTRVISPPAQGGYGLDAQWNDDFHHALHTALTGDDRGYFSDFEGLPHLAKALTDGFVYDGLRSRFRGRRHGSSSKDRPGEQFVVCTQNHDQVANAPGVGAARPTSIEQQRLAAAILLCAPFLPLLFMGEEYGESNGFYYFTDHTDPALAGAVSEGRRNEVAEFLADAEFADPQDPFTFERSKLCWNRALQEPHAGVLAWYRDLIALRKQVPALSNCRKDLARTAFDSAARWLAVERQDPAGSKALLMCNFSPEAQSIVIPFGESQWTVRLGADAQLSGGRLDLPGGAAAVLVAQAGGRSERAG
jgi:maltooligosyltrehalose trehalohydrolase